MNLVGYSPWRCKESDMTEDTSQGLCEADCTQNQASIFKSFPSGTSGKNLPANAGDVRDVGLIPGSSCGGGNSTSPQYSCYSLWNHQESDMTEHLSTYSRLFHV